MSSSADYWRKRSEDRFKAAERTVESQQEDLTHFFDDALKDTQVVIRDFWARYAKDNKISYAEAQKLLNLECPAVPHIPAQASGSPLHCLHRSRTSIL